MRRRIKEKVSLFAGKLLSKENEGLEAWEILLGALLGVLVIIVLFKALNGTLPGLWDGLVNKFKSTLGI